MSVNSSDFKDNAAQLTGEAPPSAPSYVSAFNAAVQLDVHEEKRQLVSDEAAKDKAKVNEGLDIVRQVNAGQSNISTSLAFSAVARRTQETTTKNSQKAGADATFLALLEQIRDLENNIAAMYGANFAEDMVEGLHQNGKISDGERDRINAIEDPDERRQAIAELIQEKLDSGEITMADLSDYEWADQWLSLHADAIEQRNDISNDVETGKRPMAGAPKEAIDYLEGKMAALGRDMSEFQENAQRTSQDQVASAPTSSNDFDAFG